MRQRHNNKKGFELLRSNSETIAHKTRMGFGLVEAAIVLGVVGVVIGAIWYSAAKFYEDYKVNKTVEDIFSTARNIQNLISIRDSETIGGGGIELTATLLGAGVFPTNWIDGNIIRSPFGDRVRIFNYALPINPDHRFLINLYSVPTSSCINLVVKISSAGAMAGSRGSGAYGRTSLGSIGLFDGVTYKYLSDFPVSGETAASFCYASNHIVSVSFSFGYTRIN